MTSQVTWTHDAHFAKRAASAAKARAFVGSHLSQHDLPYLVDDVQLVVGELVSNVLVHARTAAGVTLQELPFSVTLTVRNGRAASSVARITKPIETSGRGLAVVDHWSDDWGVETAMNGEQAVWALFGVRPPPYPQPSDRPPFPRRLG